MEKKKNTHDKLWLMEYKVEHKMWYIWFILWEAFLVARMEWGGGGTQCKGKMSWDKENWVNNKEHNKYPFGYCWNVVCLCFMFFFHWEAHFSAF